MFTEIGIFCLSSGQVKLHLQKLLNQSVNSRFNLFPAYLKENSYLGK